MTTNEPIQSTVVEATELGKNCGCCAHIKTVQVGAIVVCRKVRKVMWGKRLEPKEGTTHPPGRSVCPEFSPME